MSRKFFGRASRELTSSRELEISQLTDRYRINERLSRMARERLQKMEEECDIDSISSSSRRESIDSERNVKSRPSSAIRLSSNQRYVQRIRQESEPKSHVYRKNR